MFTLKAENNRGEVLTLTQNKNYVVTLIEGITGLQGEVNTSKRIGRDGSRKNSARAGERNIVIHIKPQFPVEENRQRLYKFFRAGREVRLYFENKHRSVYIDGTVETSPDGSLFELSQTLQVSIICPNPYFYDVDERVQSASRIEPSFEFPFSIEASGIPFSEIIKENMIIITNDGDVEFGFTVEITCSGQVVNPRIYKAETGEFFGISTTINEGDKVILNTISGERSITLVRNGISSNIINSIEQGSKWFTMDAGDNIFAWECESGTDNVEFLFHPPCQYEGV